MQTKPTEFSAVPRVIVSDFPFGQGRALAPAPASIARQAANLLYDEVKSGNGLAGACRFVDFLRRHGGMGTEGRLSFDIGTLSALVMLVADSPTEQKAAVIDLIESKLPLC